MCKRFLVVKPEGKRPIGRPRYSWKDNIKVNLEEIGWVSMGWIDVAEEDTDKWWALVNMATSLGFHKLQGIF
jgi:hypothetical protein